MRTALSLPDPGTIAEEARQPGIAGSLITNRIMKLGSAESLVVRAPGNERDNEHSEARQCFLQNGKRKGNDRLMRVVFAARSLLLLLAFYQQV